MNTGKSVLVNLIAHHSGKWYEVVLFCKQSDDAGEITAKFVRPNDALMFAKITDEASAAAGGLYTAIVVR